MSVYRGTPATQAQHARTASLLQMLAALKTERRERLGRLAVVERRLSKSSVTDDDDASRRERSL